jgi:hypothetical protein
VMTDKYTVISIYILIDPEPQYRYITRSNGNTVSLQFVA